MDETAQKQTGLIHRVVDVLSVVNVLCWLFGGWGLDARIGRCGDPTVPVMSVAGMPAMKEQYPTLRNGAPWREKDLGDIAVFRDLRNRARRKSGGPWAAWL